MTQLFDRLIRRLHNLILNAKEDLLDDVEEPFEIDLMLPSVEPGVNAKWKSMCICYKRNSSCLPLYAFNITSSVRHAHLVIESKLLPICIKIPLVSISYVEADEQTDKLDIRGQNFRLVMWNVNADSIEDLQEWLRFLIVRQRIPHSILGLPFDWELQHAKKSAPKIKFCWSIKRRIKL